MLFTSHTIDAIEGVGATWSQKLVEAGFDKTEKLLLNEENFIAFKLRDINGFPLKRLREFIACANFLLLDNLTGQHAEALFRAGYRSLKRLSSGSPDKVVDALDRARDEGVIPESASLERVFLWQKQALNIQWTSSLSGRISGRDKSLLKNIEIHCGDHCAITDEKGFYFLPIIPYGESDIVINNPQYARKQYRLDIKPSDNHKIFSTRLESSSAPTLIEDEYNGEAISNIRSDDKIVFVKTELSEIPENSPLIYKKVMSSGDIRLLGAYRKRQGAEIHIIKVDAPAEYLPQRVESDTIVRWRDNELHQTNESLLDIRTTSFKTASNRKIRRITPLRRLPSY